MFYSWLNKTLLWIEGPFVSFIKKWGLLIAVIILILFLLKGCDEQRELHQQLSSERTIREFEKKSLENTIEYWKDQYGGEHARLEKEQASNKAKSEYIDSIAKVLKVKPKQIESIGVVKTETDVQAPVKTIVKYDTIQCDTSQLLAASSVHIEWQDQWTMISGDVFMDTTVNKNRLRIVSIDTITSVDYWERKKILGLRIGKKKGYVDFSNMNRNNKITGGKKLELSPPKDRWSIGVGVGVGYTIGQPLQLNRPPVFIGVMIQRSLIKF